MLKLLLPVLLLLVGTGAGVGAAYFMRPEPEPVAEAAPSAEAEETAKVEDTMEEPEDSGEFEYARLNNQFVVPIVRDQRVAALVVMSLTIEVEAGGTTTVFDREPKLRDLFLQVLFDHANIGGFDGPFTESGNMKILRSSLREAARSTLGDTVNDVLIIDLVRQET